MNFVSFFQYLRNFRTTKIFPFFQFISHRKVSVFFFILLLTEISLAYGTKMLRTTLLILAALTLLATLILFSRRRFWYRVFLPILLGALLGCSVSCVLWDGYVYRHSLLGAASEEQNVTVVVKEVVYTNAYSGTYICTVRNTGFPYSVLLSSDSPDFESGQILHGTIRLSNWQETENGFDEERYYRSKGVILPAEDTGLLPTGEYRFSITGLFEKWNHRLSAWISAHISNDGLPLAMLLGNRSSLSDSVKRDFQRLGILHLIAVSGTHFSLLLSITRLFLIRLHTRPGKRNLILILLTGFYMLLTGLSASVLRAGFMHLIALCCESLGLKTRYFSALNISCGLILLIDPFSALDMGLHLSYLSVCGCLLTLRIQQSFPYFSHQPKAAPKTAKGSLAALCQFLRFSPHRIFPKLLSLLLLNLVISCLLMPLNWLYFGEFSLIGPLANLVYIPAAGILLFLTLIYLLLYPLKLFILPLAAVLSGFSAVLEGVAREISALPHISISLLYPFIPLFLIPLALCVCILPLRKHKIRGLLGTVFLLVGMVATVFVYEAAIRPQNVVVYRNDRVKEGFVIRSDGDTMLLDVSDGSYNFTTLLLEEAKSLYATELEGYIITHYHNRHVSTLDKLSDNWILRTLYLPQPVTEEEFAIHHSLIACAERKGIETVFYETETALGNLVLTLAERVWLSRSTHPITGLSLSVGSEDSGIERLAYGSSSFAEGDSKILYWMENAEICIFGAHSPVTKKAFAVLPKDTTKAILWNGNAASYGTVSTSDSVISLHGCERLIYRFSNTNVSND